MLDRSAFAAGMHALGAAFNRKITDDVLRVYHGVLGTSLDEDAWEQAVRRALQAETFFPPPSVLLRFGTARGAPQARALETYERILTAYEGGEAPGPRDVKEQWGIAAMEAFVSAGGSRAFSWCQPKDEPFRRKAFLEAWLETAEQDPSRALPAPVRGELVQ